MSYYTLLATFLMIAGVNTVFTFLLSNHVYGYVTKPWRISSLLIFIGLSGVLFQEKTDTLYGIMMPHYFIMIGIYFQLLAAINFVLKSDQFRWWVFGGLTLLYGVVVTYYSLMNEHSVTRVIILAMLFAAMYLYATAYILAQVNTIRTLFSKEVWILFIISCLFYLAIAVIVWLPFHDSALSGYRVFASASFVFLMLQNIIFFMSMLSATIRESNCYLNHDRNRLEYLFEFLRDTAKYLEIKMLYASIEKVLKRSFGVPGGAIYLKNEDDQDYSHSMAYVFNDLDLPLDKLHTFKMGEGLSGQAVEQQQVIIIDINDYVDDEIARQYREKGVTHMVAIPLKWSGNTIGAIIIVYALDKSQQSIFEKDFFEYLGEQIALVLQNALLYKKISSLAHTDFLTGLYNRRKIQELFTLEMKRLKRSGKKLSVALIDLDHFKRVNDTYGHECGDNVIRSLSAVLRKTCRDIDYVCRWGGEEFLIVFAETSLEHAVVAAERIRAVFENTSFPCTQSQTVTISIGVTEILNDSECLETVVSRADKALYQAKQHGRNQVRVRVTDDMTK